MSLRDAYEARSELELTGVQARMAALVIGGACHAVNDDGGGAGVLQSLPTLYSEALHRFALLKQAGANRWGALMIAFETAWSDLDHALQPKH